MSSVPDDVGCWLGSGRQVALATVMSIRKSMPRPAGTQMAVNEQGEISGSVTGGCVEGVVVEAALQVIADGSSRRLNFGYSDAEAWDVGLPCGGEVEVYIERLQGG